MEKAKVVIIGGGIIGTSIAYYLTKAKVKDIYLIEKENLLGTGITQYCSGGIRSQFTTLINISFSIESLKELTGKEIGFRKLGYLILDLQEDLGTKVKMQNEMGIASECLNPQEVKTHFPYLNNEGIISASFYGEDGIADPSMLLSIYERGARERGVKFIVGTEVKRIIKKKDSVIGVETEKEFISAERVVLAAGAQSRKLGQTIGLDIPILPRRKYVGVIDGFNFDFPLIMEIPTGWYIKKEGENTLIGMSGKEEEISYSKKEESIDETISASVYRFPQTERCGLQKVLSSLSDETPDKHAIIDDSIPGLIIATGFSGHGFMHSPAAGKIVTNLVKGEKPIIDISHLQLKRENIKERIAI